MLHSFRSLNAWSSGSVRIFTIPRARIVKSLNLWILLNSIVHGGSCKRIFVDAFWHVNARAANGAAFVATRSRINPRATSFTRSLWAELSNSRLATAKSDTFGSRWSIVSSPARKFHFTTDNEFSLSPFRFPSFLARCVYYRRLETTPLCICLNNINRRDYFQKLH